MDKSKFESVIVPGGCTKYIQAPDFVWNKAFRGKAEEVYGSWLANVKKEFTGNRKHIPSRLAAKCVSKARNELLKEVISSSLRPSGYALMVLKNHEFESETWISKKSNSVFYPRKINGCSKYIRQGSWFYISTHPKSHPRKDLNLHFYDNNFEFECEWTESLNKNKLNTLTATTFRHPHKNDFFWFKFLFPFLSKFTTELLNSKT